MILKWKSKEYKSYYNQDRYFYIHSELQKSDKFTFDGAETIRKTATFIGEDKNIYMDSSDGINDDLDINEYCGRIKRIIIDCEGKPFLFFKAAYSNEKSSKIVELAEANNGKVIPFFKWSFNQNFYNHVLGRRAAINTQFKDVKKEYDIGYFCGLDPYKYPRPSKEDPSISWSDHKHFHLKGFSENEGSFINNSRKDVFDKIKDSGYKVLHLQNLSYLDYIEASYKCKIIMNPPGMGEYTSRLVDQCYLGNCIAMRTNSYDQGLTWKNHIPQIDLKSDNFKDQFDEVIENHESHAKKCQEYFDTCWTPQAIVNYFLNNID